MIRPATVRHAALLILLAVCGCHGEPDNSRHRDPLELVVVGRLLLPEGPGSRGVEVQMESTPAGGQPRIEWVLFDGQGQFTHTVAGTLTRVTVTAGREVHRVDKGGSASAHSGGADRPGGDRPA